MSLEFERPLRVQRAPNKPPLSETELMDRCQHLEGMCFGQLASRLGWAIPENPLQRKGWTGQAIEFALGATAANHAAPDFCHLGIELKTLPIGPSGSPTESTFITSIPLLTIHQQTWATSQCYAKLKRILWVPCEDSPSISFMNRRIGRAFLWSPTDSQEKQLAADWSELTLMITTGQLSEIDARLGEILQVRPKAANSRSVCYGYDENGSKILTMPRGFYLRRSFTTTLFQAHK